MMLFQLGSLTQKLCVPHEIVIRIPFTRHAEFTLRAKITFEDKNLRLRLEVTFQLRDF